MLDLREEDEGSIGQRGQGWGECARQGDCCIKEMRGDKRKRGSEGKRPQETLER